MADRRRPLLLVVISDAATRDVVENAIGDCFEIFFASSGSQAVALSPRLQPDAIVIDADLERMVAPVVSSIRALPGGEDTPIVMLTSVDDAAFIDPLYLAGATDFVTKPITRTRIAHRLKCLLRSSAELRDARESGARLARAQCLARFAWWELVPETGRFRWSMEVTSMFGIPPAANDDGISAILRWVHPSDRVRVASAVLELAPHGIEYRLVLPDGRVRTIHQEANVVLDASGVAIQMIGAAQDVTELREAERQIQELAYFDSLTRLPNRALLRRFLQRPTNDFESLAILAIDLDGFKGVNDTLGHAAGDALLREVGARLLASIAGAGELQVAASFDERLAASELVARLGGDEFVVVLRNRGAEAAATVAHRIAEALSASFALSRTEVFISSSIGIACRSSADALNADVDKLLEDADSALYHAKEKGRNNVQFFTPGLLDKCRRRMAIESSLRGSMVRAGILNRGAPTGPCDFHMLFQPKVELPSERLVGVEALMRWTSPELGFVSPAEFIPVAEDAGLIVALGEWALRTACGNAQAWAVRDGRALDVSVNVSARQFREPDFATRVAAIVAETGLSPSSLELEITEGVLMEDTVASSRILSQLKEQGVRIALDDFGTGYSSLSYLSRLPIDALKMDRSFVSGLGIDDKSAPIITAIIGLARGLGIALVIEGVETEEQLAFVAQHGRMQIQGFLFAKPMPFEALATWSRSMRPARASSSGVHRLAHLPVARSR